MNRYIGKVNSTLSYIKEKRYINIYCYYCYRKTITLSSQFSIIMFIRYWYVRYIKHKSQIYINSISCVSISNPGVLILDIFSYIFSQLVVIMDLYLSNTLPRSLYKAEKLTSCKPYIVLDHVT